VGYGYFPKHPNLKIKALKQEAGEIEAAPGHPPLECSEYPIGSTLEFVPYHACAATHNHSRVLVIGKGESVEESWSICKGW